jgi:GTP 3',8-cyclase
VMAEATAVSQGAELRDARGRPLRRLRVSVTDRCNLRCTYCMPRDSYAWFPREDLLTFEEIARLTAQLAGLGVEIVRLTGGEPLLRRDLAVLVARLRGVLGVRRVVLTTNGVLLQQQAAELARAGLDGVTVSLDTLVPARFEQLAQRSRLLDVIAGIDAAVSAGLSRIKTNSVIMRGVNDDELYDIVEFARARSLEPRFIEYMDVGGAMNWSPRAVVTREEILERLAQRYGSLRRLHNRDGAPADRYVLSDGFVVGVISSTTQPFCSRCDRARVTADGELLTCLYAKRGLDVRGLLRSEASDERLRELLARRWQARDDRGAELRLAGGARGPLVGVEALVRNPHLEMHKRGG